MRNLIFATLLILSSLSARASSGTDLFTSLDCHEGLQEQCQGCSFYTIFSDPVSKELKFFEQDDTHPRGDDGQPQYFKHVRLNQYQHEGKTSFHFSGVSTRKMATAYNVKGLTSIGFRLAHLVFDLQNVSGSLYEGTLRYKILGITVYSSPARCELNAQSQGSTQF